MLQHLALLLRHHREHRLHPPCVLLRKMVTVNRAAVYRPRHVPRQLSNQVVLVHRRPSLGFVRASYHRRVPFLSHLHQHCLRVSVLLHHRLVDRLHQPQEGMSGVVMLMFSRTKRINKKRIRRVVVTWLYIRVSIMKP